MQIRRYLLYGSLQSIKSLPVLFFILMLDFVLALLLTKKKFNTIILVTCRFLKRVTLIDGANIWSAEDWTHAFFKRLDLIDLGFLRELITDNEPKFVNRF